MKGERYVNERTRRADRAARERREFLEELERLRGKEGYPFRIQMFKIQIFKTQHSGPLSEATSPRTQLEY